MGELGVVEAEQTESGELTIRLFKRKYILSDEGEVIKTKGEPIDVTANSWIDVRLDICQQDSIWNTNVSGSSRTPVTTCRNSALKINRRTQIDLHSI